MPAPLSATRLLAVVLFLSVALRTQAVTFSTDFEDLILDTQFPPGSSFTSGGLNFTIHSSSGSNARVRATNGFGNRIQLPYSVGLIIHLPEGVQQVSFSYADFASGSGISLDQRFFPTPCCGMQFLNGWESAGVSATSTASPVPGGIQGEVVLSGPISWLAVGGTEFRIDNIAVVVPDPSTTLPGDYNGDNVVDAADYTVWRDHLHGTFDLNGNGNESGASAGFVDHADYDLWISQFGSAGSAGLATHVPEPGALYLIALAIVGVLGLRRR